MSDSLGRRLLQTKLEGPHHEALLAVMLANAALDSMMDDVFDGSTITQPQYNVLRILNGVHPSAHSRGEIARRMVRRAPDLLRTTLNACPCPRRTVMPFATCSSPREPVR